MTKENIYALYVGEQYIYAGTIKEIMEQTGMSKRYLYNLASKSYKKRYREDHSKYWCVKLEGRL